MPELKQTRFGRIEYVDEDVVTFRDGLIGFPELQSFLFLSTKPESPFRWLQSIDVPAMAFLVADPCALVAGYQPELPNEALIDLGIGTDSPAMLLATASIPRGKPEDMTLNLAGPIVVNAELRVGKQFVLDDDAYTIKHRVIAAEPSKEQSVAA